MPSAGLQMFGAGLQLQPVTPGVVNQGNVNLSGTALAGTFGNNQFANDGTLVLGKRITFKANYTGPLSGSDNNIIVGQGLNLTGGTDTNNTQGCVLIGSAWTFTPGSSLGMNQSVVIGGSALVSTTTYPQHVVLIGNGINGSGGTITNSTAVGGSASVQTSDATAVGFLSKVTTSRGVALGSNAQATGTGDNICIGYAAADNGNPSMILIGSGIAPPNGTRSNAIVIGAATQTDVQLGPYVLGLSTGRTVKVADANHVMTSTEGTVGWSSITAARTNTLPLAASVPAGYIVRVGDFSGSASGVNTITTGPSGTDTIVGAGTPTVTTAYGWDRYMSDGVSKWICNNNL